MSRLAGEAEMRNGLAPQPRVLKKNHNRSHSCRGTPWGVRYPNPTPASPDQGSSAGRRTLHNFGCKSQWRLWLSETEGCWSTQVFLLKGSCMDLLTKELTCSELQCWDSNTKGALDIWGGAELSGFKERARRAPFPKMEVLTIVSLLSPLPFPACRCRQQPYQSLHQPG